MVDGPFAEAKELIAGYWIWQVKSMEEAVEWAKRIPFHDGQVELRRAFEAEDFGEEFTPELQEQEERLRNQLTHRAVRTQVRRDREALGSVGGTPAQGSRRTLGSLAPDLVPSTGTLDSL